MTITFVNGTGSTNDTVTQPAGTSSTTVLMTLLIWEDSGGGSPSGLNGFTLAASTRVTNAFGYMDGAWYYKVRGAGAASYTFTVPGDATSVLMLAYDGVDNTTPIDCTGSAASNNGTTATATAITTATAGAWLLFGLFNYFDVTITPPTGYSARRASSADSNVGTLEAYDKEQASPGTSGAPAITGLDTGTDWAVMFTALRPAGGAAAVSDPGLSGSRRNIRANGVYRMGSIHQQAAPTGFRRRDRIYVPALLSA